ncbi:hypothetical protein QYF36_013922 [Acer negundo]|nr:hypothetical protein QYF36_013922 [Acer negundo]
MEEASTFLAGKRHAVVTGANKGIGFEICKHLASKGVVVVLTSRDEKRGLEAVEKLRESEGLSDYVIFHQLDVTDPASIATLADFIKTQFGKLDILVNNAAISGVILDSEAFVRAFEAAGGWSRGQHFNWNELATQTFEVVEECLKTNYYGAKRMVEALISLLQLSDSARIVNVSSVGGLLKHIPIERDKTMLSDVESLTEEKIDEFLNKFMKDFKEGSLEKQGWQPYLSTYTVSKAALNAYTRMLANKYPKFLINCVCPGSIKTDINCNTGIFTPEEGAQFARLNRRHQLPTPPPSKVDGIDVQLHCYLLMQRYAVVTGANKGIGFEICRQLASKGIVVVLTARDENRGLEAIEKLKESGLSDYVIFHQLDVTNPSCVVSLADFIKTQFGKLDILPVGEHFNWNELVTQTFEMAEDCLNTNYYGVKGMAEALIPLQLSDSPRIVNVSSTLGLLMNIPNESTRAMLSDVESLTEEKIDQVLNKFMKDFKEGLLEREGWPTYLSAYIVSKATLNAYTRILANKYPDFLVNSVRPGFVKTDITCNTGLHTAAEGA